MPSWAVVMVRRGYDLAYPEESRKKKKCKV